MNTGIVINHTGIIINLSQVKHGKLIVDKWINDQVWVYFSHPQGSSNFELTLSEAAEFVAAIAKTLEKHDGK